MTAGQGRYLGEGLHPPLGTCQVSATAGRPKQRQLIVPSQGDRGLSSSRPPCCGARALTPLGEQSHPAVTQAEQGKGPGVPQPVSSTETLSPVTLPSNPCCWPRTQAPGKAVCPPAAASETRPLTASSWSPRASTPAEETAQRAAGLAAVHGSFCPDPGLSTGGRRVSAPPEQPGAECTVLGPLLTDVSEQGPHGRRHSASS